MTNNREPGQTGTTSSTAPYCWRWCFSSCTPSTTPARSKRHTGDATMTQARPNKHAPDTVRRSLRLPAKLVRQLDQYARTEGISANAATLRLLTDLLEDNPKADARFTVQVEPNGRMGQYVARFCGEYTGSAPTEREAWVLASLFNERRFSGTPETQP